MTWSTRRACHLGLCIPSLTRMAVGPLAQDIHLRPQLGVGLLRAVHGGEHPAQTLLQRQVVLQAPPDRIRLALLSTRECSAEQAEVISQAVRTDICN